MVNSKGFIELVSTTSTGAIIVQTTDFLEARCVKCFSNIHWSGTYWYCSSISCKNKVKNVDATAENSMLSLNSNISTMTKWTAKWLDVDLYDVRVVVTR